MRTAPHRRPLVETLEPRILYSADLAGLLGGSPPLTEHEPDLAADGDAPALLALPLAFEHNVGQAGAAFDFVARGAGYAVGLAGGDAVIGLADGDAGHVVTLRLVDRNEQAIATGDGRLATTTNYLLGAPADWHTDVGNFAAVHYAEVYAGIDLHYYGQQRQLEYDFIVAPGADAGQIRLAFDGVAGLSIADDGRLLLTLDAQSGRTLAFAAPLTYQETGTEREIVASRYRLFDDHTVGFELAAYDAARSLTIDPVLSYGTYFGTNDGEYAHAVAVDAAGNVYMTGYGEGAGLLGGLLGLLDGDEVMVTKFAPDLGSVVYSTFIGGNGDERGHAIAVDLAGNAYVTGETDSGNFPTVGALQGSRSGAQDAFVFKLNASGNALVYSTYLGGSGSGDVGYGIAVDAAGSAYVTGQATAGSFPTTAGAVDTTYASGEAFVSKLNPLGNAFAYSSFIGGSGADIGYAIAVDGAGRAVVVGETSSNDLALVAPYQATREGGSDAFVAQIDATGSAYVYSTYLGGNSSDVARAVALGADGLIYVTGATQSGDFDLSGGALQLAPAGADAFVSVLDPAAGGGASLVYSSYLGGSGSDGGRGIGVDAAGRIYVAGHTSAVDFPVTADAHQATRAGSTDGFVARIDPAVPGAAGLAYATYYGGTGADTLLGAAYRDGMLYVVGETTSSSGIAAAGGADTGYGGNSDAFAAAFNLNAAPSVSLAGTPLTYVENAAPLLLDPAATLTDADAGPLSGAAIQITINYVEGEDQLDFDTANPWGITALWQAASGTLVLSGAASAADYQSALRSVTYQNASERPTATTRTIAVTVFDGDLSSASVTREVSVSTVNDAPIISAPGTQTVDEDAVLYLTSAGGNGITIADLDAGVDSIQVTLSTAQGQLSLAGTAGLSFVTGDGSGDAVVTFTGSVSDVNAALDGLAFAPTPDFHGPATIDVETSDLGHAGGAAQVDTSSIDVNVAARNDAPVNTLPGPQVTAQNTPLLLGQAYGNGITISDVDAGVDELAVTLTSANGSVTLATTAGLTTVSGDGSALIAMTGTLADLNAALDGLTFTPAPAFNGSAGVTLTTSDQGHSGAGAIGEDTDALLITVSSNVAPAVAISGGNASYAENAAPSVIDPGLTVSDPDNTLLEQARVRISAGYVQGQDVLSFVDQAGISGSWDAASGKLTLTGTATLADYTAALRSVTYHNTSDAPLGTTRTVSFVVNDGVADSAIAVRGVDVNASNDAPLNDLPGAQSVGEDGTLVFSAANGNQLRVADVDAGSMPLEVSVTVTQGTATLSQVSGLGFSAGANGSPSMTFSGTQNAINAALNGLRFNPVPDYVGPATLQFTSDDLGAGGVGGALADSDLIMITVTPGNDAPVLTPAAPVLTGVTEDDSDNGGQSVAAIVAASIGDIDTGASSGIALIGSNAGNGAWQYSLDGGASWSAVGAVSDGSARLLTTTDHLRFVPNAADGTVASITYRAWDQTSGVAGALADASSHGGLTAFSSSVDTATITVGAINDAPAVTLGGADFSVTAGERLSLTGAGLAIADVDAGTAAVTLTLATVNGTLQASAGTSGVALGGSGTTSLTVSGSVAQINDLLAGNFGAQLTYQIAATAPPASDFLTLNVDDGGAAGSGGALQAGVSGLITIMPPADGGDPEPPAVDGGDDGTGTPDELPTRVAAVEAFVNDPSVAGTVVGAGTPGAAPADQAPDARTALAQTPASSGAATPPAGIAFAEFAALTVPTAGAHDAAGGAAGSLGHASTLAANRADGLDTDASTWSAAPDPLAQLLLAGLFDPSVADDSAPARDAETALARPEYVQALDRLRDGADARSAQERVAISSTVVLTTGVSAGYVAWLLRSGAVLSSLLSSLPAWRMLDPFPVLASRQDETIEHADQDESLESMIEHGGGAGASGTPAPEADDDGRETTATQRH